MLDAVTEIRVRVAALDSDEAKFVKGNNTAGTRVRQTLLEIKKLCDAGRKEVSRIREERGK